ncbi:MAG: hypothetical protein U0547_00330 [Dehalococcoidia bacterium]
MSVLTIIWETEEYEVLAVMSDEGVLAQYIPGDDDASWHCLRFVDRWGNTVFNQVQLEWLITDLVRLWDIAQPADRPFIDRLGEFVRAAMGETHTYIRFIGD